MAFDAFLNISGIPGESTTAGHEKWIELLSFSFGVSASAHDGGGGGGVGKASPQDFSFMKVTDSASPTLFVKLCQGAHFDKVSLACRKAGGDPSGSAGDVFVKMDFFDVLLSSLNEGGMTATDQRPLESVSFAFAKVVFQAAPLSTDGQVGDFTSAGFDFQKNKVFMPPPGGT